DAGEVGEGFDVVDDRGPPEQALEGREGRLDAGPAALALKAFEQGGFLAADVGAGAAVNVAVNDELAAGVAIAVEQALVAEDAVFVGLFEGLLEDVGLVVVFAAD